METETSLKLLRLGCKVMRALFISGKVTHLTGEKMTNWKMSKGNNESLENSTPTART